MAPGWVLKHGEVCEIVTTLRGKVDTINIELRNVVENGEWVSAIVIATATEKNHGRPVEIFGHITARVANNRFSECFNQMDFLSFFEQIGQLPPNSLEVLLVGQHMKLA